MSLLSPTPGQTAGPFFRFGLEFADGPVLVPAGSPGSIRLYGRVLDGHGDPLPDALVEIWQATPEGEPSTLTGSLHRSPGEFTGWGRAHTAEDGGYEFWTLEPTGFIAVTVFARGLLDGLHTRIYPPGSPDDALLAALEESDRATLVARRTGDGLHHDIRLQGEGETVFLAFR